MQTDHTARLNLAFFGTFAVSLGGEPVTQFRSSNNQGLLVYLALQSGRAVPREVLATLFWPDETDKNARNNLRQALFQLRTVLGDTENGQEPYLTVTRQTAAFNPESDYHLDVKAFLGAVDRHNLEAAAAAYAGELLPGFPTESFEFEAWLQQERDELHQLALEAMFELAQEYLQRGKLTEAQAIARRQLNLEPWREPAHRQLMQAYALAGDRAGALAQFEVCREELAAELAIEPAPETVALLEKIRSGEFGPVTSDAALPAPVRKLHNLPADTTPFIGRELELAALQKLLLTGDQRLVSIVGPGGMGKTRLARAVGRELLEMGRECYPDGVYFVDLAPLNNRAEMVQAIAGALDYQAPDDAQDLLPQLLGSLSRRRLLLILDNFEELLAEAPLVNEILEAAPDVAVLVTSRQRLNLASESRYELGGLDFPESPAPEDALQYTAVQLFVDSGRRAQPQFAVTAANVQDVVRICELVGGMPLALVLAAAWLELLTPADIAAEIEESLDFLAADLADLPPRQRSIQAVFGRSWRMMTAEEQAVLTRLSIFRGGFTREAAEKVVGANLRILLSLVNKSLLHREPGSGRFTIHELLRQFAAAQREQGAAADEDGDESLEVRHCRYYAHFLVREARRALGFYPLQVPRNYADERDNFRRAWDYAVEQGMAWELADMVRGMASFSIIQGGDPAAIAEEGLRALRQRGLPETHPAVLHLRVYAVAALGGREDDPTVRALFLEFAPLVEEHADPETQYWFFERVAGIHWADVEQVKAWTAKAVAAACESGDALLITVAEASALADEVFRGRDDAAARLALEEKLRYLETDYPDSFTVYNILSALINFCRRSEAYEAAIHYGRRALNVAKGWQDLLWITVGVDNLAELHMSMEQPEEAARLHLDALEWHLAIGQVWQTLGFLWAKTVIYPDLLGGAEAVVAIQSMIYHHPEVVPHHTQRIRENRAELEAEIGADAYAAAWERGKHLSFEAGVARVRAGLAAG